MVTMTCIMILWVFTFRSNDVEMILVLQHFCHRKSPEWHISQLMIDTEGVQGNLCLSSWPHFSLGSPVTFLAQICFTTKQLYYIQYSYLWFYLGTRVVLQTVRTWENRTQLRGFACLHVIVVQHHILHSILWIQHRHVLRIVNMSSGCSNQ